MINKRNLHPSLIQWIMTQAGLDIGSGELHWVAPDASSTSQYRTWLQTMGVEKDYKIHTTIQAALNETTDYRNDVVLVFPGTYAESLVKDLAGTQVIGIGRTGTRPSARINPVATAAFTGEFINSGFSNLEFKSPSTPTAACAAIIFETNSTSLYNMRHSYVEDCFFSGGAVDDAYESVGILLGALAAANTTYEFAEYSSIRRNLFGSIGGRTKQLSRGISLASPSTSQAGCEYKGMAGCDISYNKINAQATGIQLNYGATGGTGSYITHNHIYSAENTGGTGLYGIRFASAAADQLTVVTDNRVASTGTPISNGGTAGTVMANWVGTNGTLTHQLPTIPAT